MGNPHWKITKIPDKLVNLANMCEHNQRLDTLMAAALTTKQLNKDIDSDPITEELGKEADKVEEQFNCVKSNPLKYATIITRPDGEYLYFDEKAFMNVMRSLPVDLWINGKPPFESPIAARSFGQGIYICPFKKNAIVSSVRCRWDLEFNKIDTFNVEKGWMHPTYVGGIYSLSLGYHPTRCGTKDYKFWTTFGGNPRWEKEDNGVNLEILLGYFEPLVSEAYFPEDTTPSPINSASLYRKKNIPILQ